jgi:tRNA uridine 5-carboxymethylaminomethyl modification enzyme
MFTSRAEYRLILREDNADMRLTEKGHELGLVGEARWRAFAEKREAVERESARLKGCWVHPGSAAAQQLAPKLKAPLTREFNLLDLLKRPELTYPDVAGLNGEALEDEQVTEQVEIAAKYAGYIHRQAEDIERLRRQEGTALPSTLDYGVIDGLSNEIRQKLIQARPDTLGAAARIQGVTPAAVSLLLIHLKKLGRAGAARGAH